MVNRSVWEAGKKNVYDAHPNDEEFALEHLCHFTTPGNREAGKHGNVGIVKPTLKSPPWKTVLNTWKNVLSTWSIV